MSKFFLLKKYKNYSHKIKNKFWCCDANFELWSQINIFHKSILGFHFWTFINVHFSKPNHFYKLKYTNNRYYR
jgi:hypothetical protein